MGDFAGEKIAWQDITVGQLANLDQGWKSACDVYDKAKHSYLHYLDFNEGVTPHPTSMDEEFSELLEEIVEKGGVAMLLAMVHVAIYRDAHEEWHSGWRCDRIDLDDADHDDDMTGGDLA